MKRIWALTILIIFAFVAVDALAEMHGNVEVSLGWEQNDLSLDGVDIAEDGLDVEIDEETILQLEEIDLSGGVSTETIGDEAITLNEVEQIDVETVEPSMASSNDFVIDNNGVLIKYNGIPHGRRPRASR